MKLAQDCLLKSRVAYSSHNYHWFWQGYRLFGNLFDSFNVLSLGNDVKDIMHVADSAGGTEHGGNGDACTVQHNAAFPNGGAELTSFERFAHNRNASAFFVANTDYAPV